MFAKFRNLFSSAQVNPGDDDDTKSVTTETNAKADTEASSNTGNKDGVEKTLSGVDDDQSISKKEAINQLLKEIADDLEACENNVDKLAENKTESNNAETNSNDQLSKDAESTTKADNKIYDKRAQSYCSNDDISFMSASENVHTLNSQTSLLQTAPEFTASETLYHTLTDDDQESMVDVEEIRSQSVTPTPTDNDDFKQFTPINIVAKDIPDDIVPKVTSTENQDSKHFTPTDITSKEVVNVTGSPTDNENSKHFAPIVIATKVTANDIVAEQTPTDDSKHFTPIDVTPKEIGDDVPPKQPLITSDDAKNCTPIDVTPKEIANNFAHKQTPTTNDDSKHFIPIDIATKESTNDSVVAKSPDKIYIKLVELEPKLLTLGKSFDDSYHTQQAYNDILRNVKNLPGPLDEFLLKAETLLAERQLSPELANVMAETLNIIWDDVLNVLEMNQQILTLCTHFHDKMNQCHLSMDMLKEVCINSAPTDIANVQDELCKVKHLRINMLTAIMAALKQGNELLDQLKVIENMDTLDTRPDHIKRDAKHAIHEVQEWLERLHDRRNEIELLWHRHKIQLEERLSVMLWSKELDELETSLQCQKQQVPIVFSLGECANTVNNAAKYYNEWKHEGFILRDRALKLTRVIEKLQESGDLSDTEGSNRAYVILGECSEYIEMITHREHWLQQAHTFFTKSSHILSVLEKFEIDLANVNNFTLHAKVLCNVLSFTDETLKLGNDILEEVHENHWESHEIERILAEIENRKAYILGIYESTQDDFEQRQTSITQFLKQHDDIMLWLTDASQIYLQENPNMGEDLQQSKQFLLQHHVFMQDLEINGELINSLIESIKTHLESLSPNERYNIDSKAETLHQHWKDLKQIVVERVNIVTLLIDFFEKAIELNSQLDNLQQRLSERPDNQKLEFLQENWAEIRNNFSHIKHLEFLFKNAKTVDPYLQKDISEEAVKQIVDEFSKRQVDVETGIESWTTTIAKEQEVEIILEKMLDDNKNMYAKTIDVDTQLYPVFNESSLDAKHLQNVVKEKLELVTSDIVRAQAEIQQRLESTLTIQTNDERSLYKIEEVISNLKMLKSKLDIIKANYTTLIKDVLIFLENVIQLRTDIIEFFQELQNLKTTTSTEDIIKRHEAFHNSIMEKFKILINNSEGLINQLRSVEPPQAADIDTDIILRLLEGLRSDFEGRNSVEVSVMKERSQFDQFKKDLHDINHSLDNVSKQLDSINNQSIDSLVGAKTTSLAFEYFERTVELLQNRVDKFVNTKTDIENPDNRAYYDEELKKLTLNWLKFKDLVKQKRNSLNEIFECFEKVEKIDAEYKEINYFLNSISQKIPHLKDSIEASNLVNDIDDYVKNKKNPLLAKLDDARKYNTENVTTLYENIKILFESFEQVKHNINSVKERIQNEEAHIKLKNEQESAKKEINVDISQLPNEPVTNVLKIIESQSPTQQLITEQKNIVIQKTKHIFMETMLNEINDEKITTQSRSDQFNDLPYLKNTPPRFITGLKNAVAHEGERCAFECKVVGNPTPTIEWYKDGISIHNNSDYKTSNIDGLCTLVIEETFAADSAKFVCTASNLLGTSFTEANLTVLESSIEPNVTPPCFIQLLKSCVAPESSTVQFSCTVVGKPLPVIKWFKNDECIEESPKYTINYNNGEATFRIGEVLLDDDAIYTCSASNQAGIEHSSASLRVQSLQPITKPFFRMPLNNAMARVGQKIKLEALVDGVPYPDIFWFHNNKPYSPRQLKYDGGHVTLIIPQAYLNDGGEYTLRVKNSAGEAFNSCTVVVKGRLPTETSDSEMGVSDIEPIKPSIHLPLKDVAIAEGKTACLNCVIVGQPEPEVIWYHNGLPIKESPEMQLQFQGDRCSLIIKEVYEDDAGHYEVVAINSAGEASCSCHLTVIPSANNENLKSDTIEVYITQQEACPTFEKRLKDIEVQAGETIVLEVNGVGSQPLMGKWYLKNNELTSNERITVLSNALTGTFKLIINTANALDEGIYTVKIFNRSGVAECFSYVRVTPKPIKVDQPKIEYKPVPITVSPQFTTYISDKHANIGEIVKFECIIKGDPTPTVHWLFNNQSIHGSNFIVNSIGDQHTLAIPSVAANTVGKITCIAENVAGRTSCEAYLHLVDSNNLNKDSGSSNLRTITQEDNTQSASVKFQQQTFTTTTSSQMDTHEGNLQLKQLKNMEHQAIQPPETVEYTLIQEVHNKTEPDRISPRATSVPKNVVENGKCPNFVAPLKSQVVQMGTDVTIEVWYTGFPDPEIKVEKNGVQLYANNRIQIENNNKRIAIVIRQVSEFDEGRYTITATNNVGQSKTTADLIVKHNNFPPTFERRLQAQVAKVNDCIVMEVQVTGMPKPEITWMKDNKPLNVAGISQFRLSQDNNNSYRLTIEKGQISDSGKYMVKATNASGEAESIADCAVLNLSAEKLQELKYTVCELPTKVEHQSQYDNSTRHGISESKVVTEHSSTTKATMHLKHNPVEIDIPVPSAVRPITPSAFASTTTGATSLHTHGTMTRTPLMNIRESTTPDFIRGPSPLIQHPVTPTPMQNTQATTELTEYRVLKSRISDLSDIFTRKQLQDNENNDAKSDVPKKQQQQREIIHQIKLPTPNVSLQAPLLVMNQLSKDQKVETEHVHNEFKLVPGTPPEILYMPNLDVHEHQLPKMTKQEKTTFDYVDSKSIKTFGKNVKTFPVLPSRITTSITPTIPASEQAKVVVTPPPIKFEAFSPIDKSFRTHTQSQTRTQSQPPPPPPPTATVTPSASSMHEKSMFKSSTTTTKTMKTSHQHEERSQHQRLGQRKMFETKSVTPEPRAFPHFATQRPQHMRQKSDPMIYYNAIVGIPLHTIKPQVLDNRNFESMENRKHISFTKEEKKHFSSYRKESNMYSDNTTAEASNKSEHFMESSKFMPKEFTSTVNSNNSNSNASNVMRDVNILPAWSHQTDRSGLFGFRHVEPPRPGRSCSLPPRHAYDRVLSPMEFDHGPQMPSNIRITDLSNNAIERRVITQSLSKSQNRHSSSCDYKVCLPTTNEQFIQINLPIESAYIITHTDNNQANRQMRKYRSGSEVPDYGLTVGSEMPVNAHLNRDFYVKQSPIVITHLKNIAVTVMQTARFECIFQANPSPNIFWSKNEQQLANNEKYIQEYRNGVCRLTIRGALIEDAGIYVCTAVNALGQVITSGQLLVTAAPSPLLLIK